MLLMAIKRVLVPKRVYWGVLVISDLSLDTLRTKLSKSCSSRDVPGGSARVPYQVRGNLHSIARIKVEMIT